MLCEKLVAKNIANLQGPNFCSRKILKILVEGCRTTKKHDMNSWDLPCLLYNRSNCSNKISCKNKILILTKFKLEFREIFLSQWYIQPCCRFASISNLYLTSNRSKQTFRVVLRKRFSEIMQQIHRRTPVPICEFNNVA